MYPADEYETNIKFLTYGLWFYVKKTEKQKTGKKNKYRQQNRIKYWKYNKLEEEEEGKKTINYAMKKIRDDEKEEEKKESQL